VKQIFKTLSKFTLPIVIIVALLVGQAMCDLALPDYTSKIVNIGIQQNGIENSAMEVITEEDYNKIITLSNNKKEIEKSYKLLNKKDLSESEFDKYVSNFNPNEGRIKLKIEHIKRVAKISRKLATNLNLDEEYIRLAEVIGLFHDIGRFKQIELFNTFSDKDSVNHAEFSVKTLFDDNLIANFNIDEKYHQIIKSAVLNHNKPRIDSSLTGDELLFAKIIRDADKLDIFYTICEYDFESIFWYPEFDCERISDVIINQFINDHSINYPDIKTNADVILCFYAYIYDFNFDFSLGFLKTKDYLETFASRVKQNFSSEIVRQQIDEILKISNDYLNSIF